MGPQSTDLPGHFPGTGSRLVGYSGECEFPGFSDVAVGKPAPDPDADRDFVGSERNRSIDDQCFPLWLLPLHGSLKPRSSKSEDLRNGLKNRENCETQVHTRSFDEASRVFSSEPPDNELLPLVPEAEAVIRNQGPYQDISRYVNDRRHDCWKIG